MSVSNIDHGTALRITLVARAMPVVELATLIGVFNDRLGLPLEQATRSRITVTNLKTSIDSLGGEDDGDDFGGREGLEPIKLAVRILWGETSEVDIQPELASSAVGSCPAPPVSPLLLTVA